MYEYYISILTITVGVKNEINTSINNSHKHMQIPNFNLIQQKINLFLIIYLTTIFNYDILVIWIVFTNATSFCNISFNN